MALKTCFSTVCIFTFFAAAHQTISFTYEDKMARWGYKMAAGGTVVVRWGLIRFVSEDDFGCRGYINSSQCASCFPQRMHVAFVIQEYSFDELNYNSLSCQGLLSNKKMNLRKHRYLVLSAVY